MHAREIRPLSDAEIEDAIEKAREELFNLRFQRSVGQLTDTNRPRFVRRNLARLMTVRHEREIWAAFEAGSAAQG
ncbi:MAG: 50S ribosomal protein L29 [Ardenticatenales bacterium]|jgi:large subunit ribosomal protein L29|nr:50S ribosomal protein L29 [Ardenticatenales bacterium]MCC7018266.1 50S ribosomal protein L29 [Ardenticatenales bacterium]